MSERDWRHNIAPATAELKRIRATGRSLDEALDALRGRGLTLAAVQEAVLQVEGMDEAEILRLFDERGDWDEF